MNYSRQQFAKEKLTEGKMNENYAVLYQEFLMDPKTSAAGEAISQKMFTDRLYFDDKKIRYVIVRHSQMELEEIYTCVQGVAYPRIYTEDAAILFQDGQQRRYSATVDYSLKKLLDCLLYTSNIRTTDMKLSGNFPLCLFFFSKKPETAADHFIFLLIQH